MHTGTGEHDDLSATADAPRVESPSITLCALPRQNAQQYRRRGVDPCSNNSPDPAIIRENPVSGVFFPRPVQSTTTRTLWRIILLSVQYNVGSTAAAAAAKQLLLLLCFRGVIEDVLQTRDDASHPRERGLRIYCSFCCSVRIENRNTA